MGDFGDLADVFDHAEVVRILEKNADRVFVYLFKFFFCNATSSGIHFKKFDRIYDKACVGPDRLDVLRIYS